MENTNKDQMLVLETGELSENHLKLLATIEDEELLDDILRVLPNFQLKKIALSLPEAIAFVHEKHIKAKLDELKRDIAQRQEDIEARLKLNAESAKRQAEYEYNMEHMEDYINSATDRDMQYRRVCDCYLYLRGKQNRTAKEDYNLKELKKMLKKLEWRLCKPAWTY